MPFQAYNKNMVPSMPICNIWVGSAVIGYEFEIRYPSYRGTFLSCVEELRFAVDGESIDNKNIYFSLNGKQFLLDEIPELFKEYWYVLDSARITVLKSGGIAQGPHIVDVYMRHRVPYTGYFGQYMVLEGNEKKTLICD